MSVSLTLTASLSAVAAPLVSPLLAGWLALACTGCNGYLPGEDWRGYERTALAMGKMRIERAPGGMPVSRQALADNFRRIAFGIEHDVIAPGDPAASEGGRLRRWLKPVRWHLVSLGQDAPAHAAMVGETADRIARATGHDIREARTGEPSNLTILVLRPEDYGKTRQVFSQRPGGGWLAAQVDRFGRAPHTPCVGIFLHAVTPEAGRADEILYALAVIRAGLPPRLGQACIEEEMAQAMGLPNDDERVRPSVFNDDQEFALLTGHDEALLRILYDQRLSAGMTEDEAMQIVPKIIAGMDTRGFDGRAALERE
ncbi:MAG: DUF2927 domain-containing protein [Pseudomonadota bacterium]